MKHVFLIAVLFLITHIGTSQTWYGSDQTFQSGTYSANIGANITIAPNATVEFTSFQLSSGSMTVGRNATVIIDRLGSSTLNGKLIIDSSANVSLYTNIATNGMVKVSPFANLSIAGDWDISNGSVVDSGTVAIAGTLTLRQPNVLTLTGCSAFVLHTINNLSAPNPITGTGYISIYNYISNGNPLTSSSTLSIRYNGTDITTLTGMSNDGHTTITPHGIVSYSAMAGCAVVTPVLFSAWTAQNVSGSVGLSWTTTMEQNNKYFVVEGSMDGKTFDSMAVVKTHWFTGNSSSPYTYNFLYYIPVTKEGGMILFFLIIFIVSGICFIKKQFVLGMKFMFIFSIVVNGMILICSTSCTKTNNNSTTAPKKYSFFRLKQVDLDGHVNYNQKILHINL